MDGYIIGGAGAFILFLLGVVWRISEGKATSLTLKVDQVVSDLAAFKLEVAKEYVSVPELESMERRIMAELGKIESVQREIFEELKGKADK